MDRTNAWEITTWKVIGVFLLGVLVGLVVLYADAPSWNHGHRMAAHASAEILWAALMCAQTGLWLLALAWLWPTIRALPAEYGSANRSEIVGSSAVIFAIVLALAVVGMVHPMWPEYLPGHEYKLGVLTVLGGLVGLVAARGVWIVHGGLKLLARDDLKSEQSLRAFLTIQDDVGRFLGVLGAIIGCSSCRREHNAERFCGTPSTSTGTPTTTPTTDSSWFSSTASELRSSSPRSTCRPP